MDLREQRMMMLAGLVLTTVGGAALFMEVIVAGAIALATGALVVLASIVSRWFNDE